MCKETETIKINNTIIKILKGNRIHPPSSIIMSDEEMQCIRNQ